MTVPRMPERAKARTMVMAIAGVGLVVIFSAPSATERACMETANKGGDGDGDSDGQRKFGGKSLFIVFFFGSLAF